MAINFTGAGGASGLAADLGISTESFGFDLKGRSPQSQLIGSTLLTKTYAFELFATTATRGAALGALSPSSIYYFGLNPQQINFSDYSAGTTTYTAGGVVVEGGAQFLRQYTITGRSGVSRRRGYSAGEVPSQDNANKPARITTDGHRLFRELHKFLKHYSNLKSDPSVSYAWSLAFHDFINDDHFIINPRQFTVDRRGGGDYSYTITFDAVTERNAAVLGFLQQIGPFADRALTVASTTTGALSGLANDILDAGEELGGIIEQGARTLNVIANELRRTELRARNIPDQFNTWTDRVGDEWDAAIEQFKTLGTDVEDKEKLNLEAATKSQEVAEATIGQNVLQQGQRALSSQTATPREITVVEALLFGRLGQTTPQAIEDSFDPTRSSSLLQLRKNCLIAEGVALGNAENEARRAERVETERSRTDGSAAATALGSQNNLPSFASYPKSRVAVLRGDTLASIALRSIGDRRAAPYIAKINGLRYPFISESGEPGTVTFGTKILVPRFSDRVQRAPYGNRRASEDKRLYGQDLRLTTEGDLIATGSKTDLAVISGVPNLKQAFETIRIRTRLGSNAVFPGIGYPDLIGAESSQDNIAASIIGARQCALSDPRIASTSIEQARDLGNGVLIALTCRAINNTDTFSVAGTVERSQ